MRSVFWGMVVLWMTCAAVSAQSIVISGNSNSLGVSGMLASVSSAGRVPAALPAAVADPKAAEVVRAIADGAAIVPDPPAAAVARDRETTRDSDIEQLRQEIRELKSLLTPDALDTLNLPATAASADKPLLNIFTQRTGCLPCLQMHKDIDAGCFAGCQLRYFYSGAERYPTIKFVDAQGKQRTFVGWSESVPAEIMRAVGLQPAAQYAAAEASDNEPEPAVQSLQYRAQWPPQWNVEGHWNASREYYLSHLRSHPNHRGKFWQAYPLESWSREQLAALHDDDHNGRVQRLDGSAAAVRQPIMTTVSQPVYRQVMSQPSVRRSSRTLRMRSCPTCPGGSCPSGSCP